MSNLLLATAVLLALGYSFDDLIRTVSQLKGVNGRMELIKKAGKPTVIVDYAHTPDALEKALNAAREHCKGNPVSYTHLDVYKRQEYRRRSLVYD